MLMPGPSSKPGYDLVHCPVVDHEPPLLEGAKESLTEELEPFLSLLAEEEATVQINILSYRPGVNFNTLTVGLKRT